MDQLTDRNAPPAWRQSKGFLRRVRVSRVVSLVAATLAAGWLGLGIALDAPWLTFAAVVAVLGLTPAWWLHGAGWHTTARVTWLLAGTTATFIGAQVVHPVGSMHAIFFALFGMPWLLFSWRHERRLLAAFALLPIGLWTLSWATGHSLLGPTEVAEVLAARYVAFASAVTVFALLGFELGIYASSLSQRERELEEALALADEANRAKADFLANMSYEIRTPMNAVIGLTHLLLRTDLEPKQAEYLARIEGSGKSLLGVIDDILDYSKVEAGKLSLESVPLDVEELLDEVTDMVAPAAQDKGLEFLLSVGEEVPRFVLGDPLRVKQILLNLLSNAVKFTSEGQVLLRVGAEQESAGRTRLCFESVDSGIGMSEEQTQLLFDPFVQADTSTPRRFGGTGLGLAISRDLARLMGGTLTCTSSLGVVTTFRLELPLPVTEPNRPAPMIDVSFLRGATALVVDDNDDARRILTEMVGRMGLDVVAVASGEEALAQAEPFDVALVDWKMPELDGVETARRLLEGPTPPRAVVLVTSYDQDTLRAAAVGLEVQAVLGKPISGSGLLDALSAALGPIVGEPAPPPGPARDRRDPRLLGRTALLVEDHPTNQLVATGLLQGFGMKVELASDGREAIELLDRLVEHVDVVLMDLQMPVLDGRTATTRLREDRRFDDLPIIAMTAHAMSEERGRCLDAGMNDYVTKPIDPGVLQAVLARWLPGEAGSSTSSTAPVATDSAAPGPPLPGFDVEGALRRVNHDDALLRRILGMFRDSEADTVRLLQQTWSDDRAATRARAHTLRGVAANIGAVDLTGRLLALEEALDAGRCDGAMLEDLQAEMDRALAGIDAFLAS